MISYNVMKYNRILCIACAIGIAFITLFSSCITAFASNPFIPNLLDPNINYDEIVGSKPITAEEARDAAFQIYGDATGIDEDNLDGMLCFVVEDDFYRVAVYAVEYPDEPIDYIMYIDDKQIYSFVYDMTTTLSTKTLTTVTINEGMDSGFAIMTKTFNFLMTNPLCSLILGLSFTFFSFRLIRCGIRTVRTI